MKIYHFLQIYVIIIIFFGKITFLFGVKQVELTNTFIKIIGDEKTGRFIIQTREGDPDLLTDQNSYLLYHDKTPTSFTTLRIDGQNYRFGSSQGIFIQKMKKEGSSLRSHWRIKKIDAIQELKIVKGINTGHLDTVDISYEIKNNDNREHDIGLRIMLDTYLGKEDGAPFRIPVKGAITSETILQGENLPDYWYVYDQLVHSSVRAQGVIKNNGYLPDKLIFCSWIRFDENDWYFPIEEERSFARTPLGPKDSAVAIYWDTRKYNPDQSFTVKTLYGVYGTSTSQGKIFNMALSSPYYIPGHSFLISSDIQNVSKNSIEEVKVNIVLPSGLNLSLDEKQEKFIGTLSPSSIKHITWNIVPGIIKVDEMSYQVQVSGILQQKKEKSYAERKIKKLKDKEKLVTELLNKNIEVQESEKEVMVEFKDVMFKFNSYELTAEAKRRLDTMGEILLKYKNFSVKIFGHTDNIGTHDYNQKLSEARAKSVLDYFINHQYVVKNQIHLKGYGETHPIDRNTTEEGRKRNRRVEVVIIPMK